MGKVRQSRLLAGRLIFVVVLMTMGCVFVSSSKGTATASSTAVQPTAPANNAVVSGPLAGCPTIPGTTTPVGAACFPPSLRPSLNNPQDPVAYGADKTGVNDSAAAINAALAAGDVYFQTPGTYFVSLTGNNVRTASIVPPAGRTIECVPGVSLKETATNYAACGGDACGILSLLNPGNTVVGCDFQGGNSAPGSIVESQTEGPDLIDVSSNNETIEGNTFENTWSNSAVQVNSNYTGIPPSNFLIQYNTFTHNPGYAINEAATVGGTIQYNISHDANISPEYDACTNTYPRVTQNVITQYNELDVTTATAYSGWSFFIGGGTYPNGCDYSTNIVRNNYCTSEISQPAWLWTTSSGYTQFPAHYSNNIVGPNCALRTW